MSPVRGPKSYGMLRASESLCSQWALSSSYALSKGRVVIVDGCLHVPAMRLEQDGRHLLRMSALKGPGNKKSEKAVHEGKIAQLRGGPIFAMTCVRV